MCIFKNHMFEGKVLFKNTMKSYSCISWKLNLIKGVKLKTEKQNNGWYLIWQESVIWFLIKSGNSFQQTKCFKLLHYKVSTLCQVINVCTMELSVLKHVLLPMWITKANWKGVALFKCQCLQFLNRQSLFWFW